MRAPDRTCDTWPRLFDTKDTFDIIAVQFFTRGRIHDCRFNSEERKGRASGFRGGSVRERSDDVRSRFSLPVSLNLVRNRFFKGGYYIDDSTSIISDHFPVPFPDFGGDGFSDRPEDSQT